MSEVFPLHQYPIRPRARAGESLPGYCLRIDMLNGHSPIAGVIVDSQVKASTPELGEHRLLSILLGRTHAETWFIREHQLLVGDGESRLAWRKTGTRQRFCPECMRIFGFHCILWNLAFVTACPLHRCKLLERCTSCLKLLTWFSLSGFNCKCGIPISSMVTQKAGAFEVRLARIVAMCKEFEEYRREVGIKPLSRPWPQCTASDLYAGIDWVLYARNLLQRSKRKEVLAASQADDDPAIQKSPGEDVLQFIAGLPFTARRATRLLLMNAQFGNSDVLVNPRTDNILRQLDFGLLERSQRLNKFTCWFTKTVQATVAEHAVPIPRTVLTIYRPSLSAEERLSLNIRLQKWWRALMERVAVAEGRVQLSKLYQLTLHTEWGLAGFSSNVMRTLNLLFSIVDADIPVDRFVAVTTRWQVSEAMRAGPGDLADIASVIAGMNPAEHAYLFELLLHDVISSTSEEIALQVCLSAICS